MHAVAIIPARLGSTRFPEKVLAARTGKPLVQHVAEAASGARSVRRVVVATDSERVVEALRPYGTEVVMTGAEHPNGTSRLAEAAAQLGLGRDEIVVNVQGDEPEAAAEIIDLAVSELVRSGAEVATAASPFAEGEDPSDPNIVKAIVGQNGLALYFTRARAPFHRDPRSGPPPSPPLKHVGLYVYRGWFLERYVTLAPTPLERTEMLEQLRIIEHGHRIAVAIGSSPWTGIDTPAQYDAFVTRYLASGRR
ncbi:MAG: 3-deoxy-manno-octulosonate cytidylyltransferase [Phycisphaerae bacterium]|nr:3-deoxy-manno-octulosonate cytidylyltransferase [Phycisphaerae bacterium]